MNDDASKPPASPAAERAAALLRALRKHRQRLERTLVAIRGDLAEAERAPEFRRAGETLLAYLGQVPIRATSVALPDPADPERRIEIALDPALKPQANAARYFKRAAKAERGVEETPVRSRAVEAERERALEHATRLEAELAKEGEWSAARERRLGRLTDDGLLLLPPVLRREVPALRPATESIVDDAGTQEIVH